MTPKNRVSASGLFMLALSLFCVGLLISNPLNVFAFFMFCVFVICGMICFCAYQIISFIGNTNVRITDITRLGSNIKS